jgi:trans-aconitate methyltransferase
MESGSRRSHWESIYSAKGETGISWFQETPVPSLELLELAGAQPSSAIVDAGGGASRLVDRLLAQGFEKITVLDLSAAAPAAAPTRLGEKGSIVKWALADVTEWEPPPRARNAMAGGAEIPVQHFPQGGIN